MFKKVFGSTIAPTQIYTLIAERAVPIEVRQRPGSVMDLAHEVAKDVTFGARQCGYTASECVAGIGETLMVRTTVRVANHGEAERLMRKLQARSNAISVRIVPGDQTLAQAEHLETTLT